jgi:hypothetical protein
MNGLVMSADFSGRRRFLKALGIAGAGALAWPLGKFIYTHPAPSIASQGISPSIAHQLREPHFPPITHHSRNKVVIVGSGVAGLTAARELQKQGLNDFTVLELESLIGGNAASGENAISAFPWGAHYLPVPGADSAFLYPFLREENIVTGFDAQGLPYYNELYLCHDLHERLFLNGSWQEGLAPTQGIKPQDKQDFDRFFNLVANYKQAKGNDGKPAFTIPVAMASKDPIFTRLDRITMAHYLNDLGLYSPYLRWYINYCCRDDFGGGINTVSAWAGVHYFASRRRQMANHIDDAILVWPEGNGFLVNRLARSFSDRIQTQCMVYDISPHENSLAVNYFDAKHQRSCQIIADKVIVAIPRFVASKICHSDFGACFSDIGNLQYAPWLVANISLKSIPSSRGIDLAWDNVSFYSSSLGYINAKHQSLKTTRGETVITYYLPLDDLPPKEARKQALARTTQEWRQQIINDLENMHDGITGLIQDIQYRILGHGMICPTPNVIQNLTLTRSQGNLFFAHSDMSGLSLFEEAYWQGMQTAEALLATLKAPIHF